VGQGGGKSLGLTGNFSPAASGRAFTVSFWAKTQQGYGADGGEAWISISLPSSGGNTTVKIPDTQGAWAFVSVPAFTPCASGASSPCPVSLELYTQKASTWVLIDDIQFLPVDALSSVNAYDPRFGLVTAAMTNQSSTRRTLFDDSQVPVAEIGPVESPTELLALWQVRDDPSGQLTSQQLNQVSRVRSREAGGYEPFTDDWKSRWQATSPEKWSVSGRALNHVGSGSDTCTWLGYGQQLNYGVRVQVLPPAGSAAPAGKVGIKIGNLEVSWEPATEPGTGYWYLGQTKLTNSFGKGTFSYDTDWMFAVVDSRVLFWAGGRLIIDSTPQISSPGVLVLEAATDVSFTGLVTFVEPIVDVVFKDGVGNDRQVQQMADGLNVVVAQFVYDGLLRPAIRSKASTIPMSAVGPLFVYQGAYLTNGGPSGTLWKTGTAEGDINTYWPGDGGYPFSREQYEASPLGRITAVGKPGESFSLAGHPTRFAYGCSTDQRYRTTTLTDPNGVSTVTTMDRAGNVVSRKAGPTQVGGTDYAVTSYSHTYSSSGQTNQVLLPRSGTTITEQIDFLGRLVLRQASDSGVTRFIHDRLGRLSYVLYAEGLGAAGQNTDRSLYWTYDALDRVTEAGTVDAAWSSLPSLPAGGATPPGPTVVRKRNSYFGAGTADIGRLQQTVTYQPGATSADVTLRYTYAVTGNVTSVVQSTTAGSVSHTGTVQYTYDNLGNTTRMVYPTRTPLPVNYRYNRRGLVSMIGNDVSPAIYASYSYNADSSIHKESLGFRGSSNVNQTYTYNSPGWVNTVSYNYFAGTVLYDTPQGGYREARYFDGTIQATSARGLYANAPPGYTYKNAYDPLGQLQFAENNISTDWGVGIGKGIQYDLNGNIQALNRGNLNLTYNYGTNSDRVSKVELYDAMSHQGSAIDFSYSPSGQVTSATPNLSRLTYDPFQRLTSTLQVAAPEAATLSFRYGSAGERVSKAHQSGGKTTTTIYVHGLEDTPLLHSITGPDGTVTEKAFIRSPNGLIAMITGDKTCYVVRDHQGSTRVVFDQNGTVLAAFDYLPFGQIMRASGDMTLVPYLYTGQEWDAFDPAGKVGLYNYRARLYDPILGRFYDTDPAFQFASPYVYVGNNPFNFADPTGMFWKEILGTLAVVGASIAALVLLPETAALGGVLLIWGGFSTFSVIGGTYAMIKGGSPNDVAEASLSFGIAGALAAAGLVLGPVVGMSLKSIGIAEFFGVLNAFSMAPSDASAADMGYYLAAGIAVSFAAETIGSVAAARLGGLPVSRSTLGGLLDTTRHGGLWNTLTRSTALETAIDASTAVRTTQKGIAGVLSGGLNYGLRSAARGDSVGRIVDETLVGAIVYGAGSAFSGLLGGRNGLVGRGRLSLSRVVSDERLDFGIKWLSEKAFKQIVVMGLDPRIRESRFAMVSRVLG
jgi:RHS repeat-associated protein